jgi:hypothetical protein
MSPSEIELAISPAEIDVRSFHAMWLETMQEGNRLQPLVAVARYVSATNFVRLRMIVL